jgi:hypothetical protein
MNSHTMAFTARRGYAAALMSQFGSAVLEVDMDDYRTLSFLLGVKGAYTNVIIAHPTNGKFPDTPPTITLSSTSATTVGGDAVSVTHTAYPYSPRWKFEEMAIRAGAFLLESIAAFQSANK